MISMGKRALEKVEALLRARSAPIGMIKCFAKGFIWSVVLYGSERWTITKKEGSFEMWLWLWLWRKKIKVKWAGRVRNDEVLTRIGEELSLIHI